MSIYSVCIFLLITVLRSSCNDHYNIGGTTVKGWEFVRDLFEENFVKERDVGASLAIYHQGEPVVNLWGGWHDRSFTKPYDDDALQLVFSTTKGVVAIAAALCVQKGWLNYSELVRTYWPEYAQNGKENTTVADILSHRAGLPIESGPPEQILNWTAMVSSLEKQRPLWSPGSAHSYHALTYGWLAGELIRRVDPKKRTVGQFVRDEIVNPLQIELYIGLPTAQKHRVSPLTLSLNALRTMNSSILALYGFYNDPRVYQAEIPAANGITNARSLARLYASLISDLDKGRQKRLLNETSLKRAISSNTPKGELDFLTNTSSPTSFAMGFMLFGQGIPVFGSDVFGHAGAGGSIALAVPEKNLSFAFVMNQMDLETTNGSYPRFGKILEKVAAKIKNS